MASHTGKIRHPQDHAGHSSRPSGSGNAAAEWMDQRPAAAAQRQLGEMSNNSARARQLGAVRQLLNRAPVQRKPLGDEDADRLRLYAKERYSDILQWDTWGPVENAIIAESDDLSGAKLAVDQHIWRLLTQQAQDPVAHVMALIEQQDGAAIHALLLLIQRLRARGNRELIGAPGEKAELACLQFLQKEMKQPAEEETAVVGHEGKSEETEPLIPQIGTLFAQALNLCTASGHEIWGISQERLVLEALHEATSNLLFYMYSQSTMKFPGLDFLNGVADLEGGQTLIIAHTVLKPDSDDFAHVFGKLVSYTSDLYDQLDASGKADYVMQHEKGPAMLDAILRKRVIKFADSWLRVATPYVELKCAFLDGWEEHDYGTLEQRGFYYFLKRQPLDVENELAGDADTTAGVVEPKSGKVALALALQEVYSSAVCHDDALQFVHLLGGKTCANGTLRQSDGGLALLPVVKLLMLQQIKSCKTPIIGLRLRDSSHHSLVLLFEQLGELGLKGAKFETIAGHNTEQIMHFMKDFQPRTAAWTLINSGLSSAIQQSREGWVLEWEVFTVEGLWQLAENLQHQIHASSTGVQKGLARHAKGKQVLRNAMNYLGEENPEFEWEVDAAKHMDQVIEGKPAYLRDKEARLREQREAQERDAQAREQQEKHLQGKLKMALGEDDATRVVMQEIHDTLGADALYNIALRLRIDFDLIGRLLPDL